MIRCLAAVITLALAFASAPAAAQTPVDLAIVVSLDRSESIDAEDARMEIDSLLYTLRDSRFRQVMASGWHGRIGLSVVAWSSFGRHEVLLPWMQLSTPADADRAARILARDIGRPRDFRHGTQTDIAFAIEVGMNQFRDMPWRAEQRVINVVADGISNIGRVARVDRDLALAAGITVNGLVMGKGSAIEVLTNYFEREVIGGPTAFVQSGSTPNEVAAAMLRKMILEVVLLGGRTARDRS